MERKTFIYESSKNCVTKLDFVEMGSKFQNHRDEKFKIEATYMMYSLSNVFLVMFSNVDSSIQKLKSQMAEIRTLSKTKPIYLGKTYLGILKIIFSITCLVYNKYSQQPGSKKFSRILKKICSEYSAQFIKNCLKNHNQTAAVASKIIKSTK